MLCYFWVDSVKLSWIGRHPTGIRGMLVGVGNSLQIFGDQSEVLGVSHKGDSQGRHRVGKHWVFPHAGRKLGRSPFTVLVCLVTQSCPTLCDPIDGSPPGSSVHGILQARTLEWVAISFSNAWKWKVKVKLLNRVRLLATPWTAAYQAPLPMRFSRQEYWSGVPLPSPTKIYL